MLIRDIEMIEGNTPKNKVELFNRLVDKAFKFLTNNIDHVDVTMEVKHHPTQISEPHAEGWNSMIEGDREVIIRIKESRSILFYISKHPNAVKLLNEMAAKEAEKKQD